MVLKVIIMQVRSYVMQHVAYRQCTKLCFQIDVTDQMIIHARAVSVYVI